MNYRVVLADRALEDIDRNARWWAKHRSGDQAIRWYEGILAAIDSLDENPQRWPVARENENFPYELRELHFGAGSHPTHRALFTIRDDRSVVVLSVRHAAQKDVTPDEL
ncbi:MAG: type II toxin-antitoxin system RelE/ParE family toxin [Planctomycetes bacterium]|nr:type II toxin-antitoxin system RelE/ParE family toxin [Planctomycetota bacterium]